MILITNLDVWMLTGDIKKAGTGNQSLYNTLLGYANNGYRVHMITSSMALKDIPSIHPNIEIHRYNIKSYALLLKTKQFLKFLLKPFFKKNIQKLSNKIQTKSVAQPKLFPFYSWLFSKEMYKNALNLVKRLNLNVAFAYGHEILGTHAAVKFAKKLNVPLITRFQGTELSQFLDEPDKLFSYTVNVKALKAPADLVVMANDGTLGDKVLDFVGVPKENYRFYMNGVVKDNVYKPEIDKQNVRENLRIPDNHLFLLYTGRFFYWKRIDRLFRVFEKTLKQYPEMTLALIGDGTELDACKNLADELAIKQNISFLGAMPHSEVMDYMNACDIYVAFHDLTNLCNPLIEACVCGKCIVTTNIGGTSDLLTHNKNALMLDTSDEEELSKALLSVTEDTAFREKLAKAAFERGIELKTWKERMEMEISEVEKVLADKQCL